MEPTQTTQVQATQTAIEKMKSPIIKWSAIAIGVLLFVSMVSANFKTPEDKAKEEHEINLEELKVAEREKQASDKLHCEKQKAASRTALILLAYDPAQYALEPGTKERLEYKRDKMNCADFQQPTK